jgi:spectinomycin phosphotransferase
VLEEPVIDREALLSHVAKHYRLYGLRLRFLPIGNDVRSAAYRLDAAGRGGFYLKLRRGSFNRASLEVPNALQLNGKAHVIAPVPTFGGRLSIPFANSRVALYPFVEGHNGFARPLGEDQWRALGRTAAALHELWLPGLVGVPFESYSSRWRRKAAGFLEMARSRTFEDPLAGRMAELLNLHQDAIQELIDNASRLASQLRRDEKPLVLTHGDLHAGNVLISDSGELFVVDWDTLMRAPKERDLMFVGAGVGGVWTEEGERRWFHEGYGDRELDASAIRYYRCERIVQDVVEYSESVLITSGESPERERGLAKLSAALLPGDVVDIALNG